MHTQYHDGQPLSAVRENAALGTLEGSIITCGVQTDSGRCEFSRPSLAYITGSLDHYSKRAVSSNSL